MRKRWLVIPTLLGAVLLLATGIFVTTASAMQQADLNDEQIKNFVRRSYQYVALHNVINKGAMDKDNPILTGWNGTFAAKGLLRS